MRDEDVAAVSVAQARESERIIRDRYEAGLTTVTEVLRAADASLDADALNTEARIDMHVAAVMLERALGRVRTGSPRTLGGWTDDVRVAFLTLLALTGAACNSAREAPATAVTPIEVSSEIAAVHPIRSTFEAGGVVTARTTAIIASRIVATVVSVDVAPGDAVRAGQRLIALDGRDLDAARDRAAASVTALQQAAAAAVAERDAADAAVTLSRTTHDRMADAARAAFGDDRGTGRGGARHSGPPKRSCVRLMRGSRKPRRRSSRRGRPRRALPSSRHSRKLTARFARALSRRSSWSPAICAAIGVPLLRL